MLEKHQDLKLVKRHVKKVWACFTICVIGDFAVHSLHSSLKFCKFDSTALFYLFYFFFVANTSETCQNSDYFNKMVEAVKCLYQYL